MLLYGHVLVYKKVLRNPQLLELADASVEDIADNGTLKHGLAVRSPKKSFTVTCSSSEEKNQWMTHLKRSICEARILSGCTPKVMIDQSPVWVPDSEAVTCMVCSAVEFGLVNRRHHCRRCGKVVCHKCSLHRWMLPYQGSSRVRICDSCHAHLVRMKERRAHSGTASQCRDSDMTSSDGGDILPLGNQLRGDCFRHSTYIGAAGDEEEEDAPSDAGSVSD